MADIPGLAVLRYNAADFDVVKPGQFVLCAMSGARIPLDQLMYWSGEYQEAYATAQDSVAAWLKHNGVRQ